ncbi:MAG: hypothetical protein AB1552_08575 [Nitrospirota bacterium]
MEEIDELIRQYGLEEDGEHVIIPFTDKDGRKLRRFLLKRRFTRIVYTDGYYIDYPLTDVIKATLRYPERLLSEAIYLLYKESNRELPETGSARTDALQDKQNFSP